MQWWQAVEAAHSTGEVPEVSDLTHSSRQAGPETAFAAVPGKTFDGHRFLEDAIAAGAPVCIVEASREALWAPFVGRVPLVVVPDVRAALGPLAAAVHGNPSAALRTVAVTGTDGKTTSTHLIAHVLDTCGLRCGYLSSVAFQTGDSFELNALHMTTLEATALQSLLGRAQRRGRESMVVEASSEGLAQGRLEGCVPDIAVFTNLTRDHLDFHGTMERYREAKGLLFAMLERPNPKSFTRAAVLNADDEASAYMRSVTTALVFSYALESDADFKGTDVTTEGFGLRFEITVEGRHYPARVPMQGRFNAYNSLAAVAAACSQGVEAGQAIEALASFPGVPGRLERIDEGQPFAVFVDIASTPAAMENVLKALRPGTTGRLWVVFGAAGGRDPARRAGLGQVVGRMADRSVITNEDPRQEDPDTIIEAIAGGLRETGRAEGSDFVRLPDRREAIAHVFEQAQPGDTVLLAGKATETTMIFSHGSEPWDERGTARKLLGGSR